MKFEKIKSVNGELNLAGDKSISHRAVIFSAMAGGKSTIRNLSKGEDVRSTLNIVKELGASVIEEKNKLIITGCGVQNLKRPNKNLDCGNSGTTARLISGLLAAQKFSSTLIGDESLSKRPMKRIIDPLKKMGVEIHALNENNLPLTIYPKNKLHPINYEMPMASAQIKSCVLIAGLHLDETSTVIEKVQTRNHTEQMLGLPVEILGNSIVSKSSRKFYPKACDYFVPGDISSAAFPIVLTLLTRNSELIVKNVSLNPTRIGFINVLKKMQANISFEDIRTSSNEEYGNVIVKSSQLKNIEIEQNIIANIIDEIPILTIAGIFAEGDFRIQNASELRFKESDRIKSICSNLKSIGLNIEENEDGFVISGSVNNTYPIFKSFGDHRIAMTFSILSMLLNDGGEVDGFECVGISNPDFNDQIKLITS